MSTQIARPTEETGVALQKRNDDAPLMRWGFMASHPISVANMTGSKYLGSWPHDKVPAKQLLMIPEAVNQGPFEIPAQVYSDGEGFEIDPAGSWFANQPTTGVKGGAFGHQQGPTSIFRKPPKMVAYLLMRGYEKRGLCLFEEMAGAGELEMVQLFDLVLPPSVLSRATRRILEVDVRGPFLDEIRAYLTSIKGARGKLPAEGRHVFDELYAACERAWHFENNHLNESEADIRMYRAGKRGKANYGMPDERFATAEDPQLPLDLICLADTDRAPLDMQEFSQQASITNSTNEAMVEGMKVWGDKFVEALASKQAAGVSASEVSLMISQAVAERDAVWEARLNEIVKVEELKAASPKKEKAA